MNLQEIRFDVESKISFVKTQFARRYGSDPDNQKLNLKNGSDDFICEMLDNDKSLKDYGAQTGYTIHVIDTNPTNFLDDLQDLSKVPKYEISEEDYEKR